MLYAVMACIVMAYIIMAYVMMVYTAMGYTAMGYTAMAYAAMTYLYSYGIRWDVRWIVGPFLAKRSAIITSVDDKIGGPVLLEDYRHGGPVQLWHIWL